MTQEQILKIILDLGQNAVIGLIAGFFAVRMSLTKFRSQQWWERKANAYTNIIEALGELRQTIANLGGVLESSASREAEQAFAITMDRMGKAVSEVDKAIASCGFLLSQQATQILRPIQLAMMERPLSRTWQMKKDGASIQDIHKTLLSVYEVISKQNEYLKALAKIDLEIPK